MGIIRWIVLLLVLVCVSCSSGAAQDEIDAADVKALLNFKVAVEDHKGSLRSWNQSNPSCKLWVGVTCSSAGAKNRKNRVVGLDLSSLSLAADLSRMAPIRSTQMLLLPTQLVNLSLASNKFEGPIDATDSPFLSSLLNCTNLAAIDLSHNAINGSFPTRILTANKQLKALNLSHNRLSGEFLEGAQNSLLLTLGSALESLDVSHNNLTGQIPSSSSSSSSSNSSLRFLDLSNNHLAGEFPALHFPKTLLHLNLESNLFTAFSIRGCLNLQRLDISSNKISQLRIEDDHSCLSIRSLNLARNTFNNNSDLITAMAAIALEHLDASGNGFTGELASILISPLRSSLKSLDLSSNRLVLSEKSSICSPNSPLSRLLLSNNTLNGPVPGSILACSNLEVLDLSFNDALTGPIPLHLCDRLPHLQQLIIWKTRLDHQIPASLASCINLTAIILSFNNLSGEIPPELAQLRSLQWLALNGNNLSGTIPPNLFSSNLSILQLSANSLSGNIPEDLISSGLAWLDLSSNRLSGQIPDKFHTWNNPSTFSESISGGPSADVIAFALNSAKGGCSSRGLGDLLEFQGINMSTNLPLPCPTARLYPLSSYNLSSREIRSLVFLDLSHNSLTGSIPQSIGGMPDLIMLDLGSNSLTGTIPKSFGQLPALNDLDLSNNSLQGAIPHELCNLTFLSSLNLAKNNLSGQIPQQGQLTTFAQESYQDNPFLCGLPLTSKCSPSSSSGAGSSPGRTKRRLSWPNHLLVATLVSGTSALVMLACWIRWKTKQQDRQIAASKIRAKTTPSTTASTRSSARTGREQEPLSINVVERSSDPIRKMSYGEVWEATEGFSRCNLIGWGGSGEVYRAQLRDGRSVAVKKLLLANGATSEREFMAEMETLGKIQHRNLVPLIGYCYHSCKSPSSPLSSHKLLIYDLMLNGNLEQLLHHDDPKNPNPPPVPWELRKKIAMDVARGLCFLHHSCIPHIIHRDIKSSNILLDAKWEAKVSDFGMARLISALDTHLTVTTLSGTPGYVPPEYYQSFRCTRNGDVYSYGVILLELLTRRRPTSGSRSSRRGRSPDEEEEVATGNNLVGWVKAKIGQGRPVGVLDPDIVNTSTKHMLLHYLRLAVTCVADQPHKRPSMLQLLASLKELSLLHDSSISSSSTSSSSSCSDSANTFN